MKSEVLASLIDDKHEVLSLLRRLADAQAELVGQGDTMRLMKLLAAKQSLLNRLQNIEREIDPFRDDNPDSRQWSSAARREQVRQRAAECEALLQEVMSIEKQCESDLIIRRDSAAERLQSMHSVTHATSAYTSHEPVRRQFDLSSDS